MFNRLELKDLALEKGDILFETFMVDKDFHNLVNTCITSVAFMYNVYKYNDQNIIETCEEYIKHYLSQKHQNVFLAEVERDGEKEYRIFNNRYHVLVLEVVDTFVHTVKFAESGEIKKTTWNIHNQYFKDSKYVQLKYIKSMYDFEQIKTIWVEWVRGNFKDIIEGNIGGTSNLLF